MFLIIAAGGSRRERGKIGGLVYLNKEKERVRTSHVPRITICAILSSVWISYIVSIVFLDSAFSVLFGPDDRLCFFLIFSLSVDEECVRGGC